MLVDRLVGPTPALAADDAAALNEAANKAIRLFNRGKYDEALAAWQQIVERFPGSSLAYQNLATSELIAVAGELKLDELPARGEAARRLEAALEHFATARRLADPDDGPDVLALNNEGNALGLLGRYDDALSRYNAAADAADREFESIPRANAALTLLQLGKPELGAREAEAIVRRDPGFVDGFAILVACRWRQGDRLAAERAYRRLCQEEAWCSLYSAPDVVKGRWPPLAVAAWADFLAASRAPAPA